MPFPYRDPQRTSRICAQELEYSCGAACARQLLADLGIEITEREVRQFSRLPPEKGIWAADLARALGNLSGKLWFGAVPDLDEAGFRHFIDQGSHMVMLKKHWIITDGFSEEGLVIVRDPMPATAQANRVSGCRQRLV